MGLVNMNTVAHDSFHDTQTHHGTCRLADTAFIVASSTPTSIHASSWNHALQHGLSEHGYTVACGSFCDTLLVLSDWHPFH